MKNLEVHQKTLGGFNHKKNGKIILKPILVVGGGAHMMEIEREIERSRKLLKLLPSQR